MARTVKRWLVLLAAVSLLLVNAVPAAASPAPYESYNYNYWKEAVPSPDAYLPERTISGRDLGISEFKDPGDVNVSPSGLIYILDSGNSRIVVLDPDFKLLRVIDGFMMDGSKETFNLPGGLFVDEQERIYVADTGNGRVVVLDGEGTLIQTITKPESDILSTQFQFQPLKLTVDHVGRVYVVAQGVYEGIMQFDESGKFIGYVGTNKVERDYGEYIWRMLSTKAQRAQMVLFVPTEFSNADIDHKGFVYATNIDPGSNEPIKRLNPSGEDVLKRFGYYDVKGDIRFRNNPGPSKLIDVKVLGDGMYSVLDATQNRVFTYDDEGHLLYIYGGKGNQVGTLKTPVAIEQSGEHHLVLDRGKNNLVVYAPTRFGARVNEAVVLHYRGEDTEAVNIWREVLKLNANYDIAYIGIGKSLLMEKKNEEALGYFELGMDRKSYSVAFKRHRREMMKEHFGTFLTAAIALIVILILTRVTVKWRRRRQVDREAGFH
ncbi:NHL repeat-containing protein [Paenibacillus xylanexedens]|uniref:DNA-binding beta-propeller fold protein YncE n=1 Tax=Paenibacillus xylanexedens TaxID=528191 RepID=A0ABS4RMT4_PAEXY|nr:NHL repeat-containing protein [Paenibacillus xylanexedens]MBP2244148.1 DNA-binding beta-propeller fold protein YncE [Paenibacillus xylanexedens]